MNPPKILGITGGIGAGKSFVSNIFARLGIPVYNSDLRAKELTHSNPEILQRIRDFFGDEVFDGKELHRKKLGEVAFADPKKIAKLNSIIHPAVGKDFNLWLPQQKSAWVIKEAAILFEMGLQASCHASLLVTAPKSIRIQRVQQRDALPTQLIEDRISKQWSDDKKAPLANFIIKNDGASALLPQINQVLEGLKAI